MHMRQKNKKMFLALIKLECFLYVKNEHLYCLWSTTAIFLTICHLNLRISNKNSFTFLYMVENNLRFLSYSEVNINTSPNTYKI